VWQKFCHFDARKHLENVLGSVSMEKKVIFQMCIVYPLLPVRHACVLNFLTEILSKNKHD